MSFKIRKITVGKGKTTGDEKAGEWNRVYYELEAEIEDERQIELAKGSMEALLDAWLRGETVTPEDKTFDMEKIAWVQTEGEKGPYQKSTDYDNLNHKALLKKLAEHKGAMDIDDFFVWTFQDGSSIGRKPRKRKA